MVDFIVLVDHRVKWKEGGKRDQYLDFVREVKKKNKKTLGHEGVGDPSCIWCTWNNSQRIDKGTGWLENERTSGDYPDYGIININPKTEKSPRNLNWLVKKADVKKLSKV